MIGTAAAVSKVLKLNADQMANAISIATSFSSGLNIIHINDKLYGGSDHRREGIAVGD